ncbi:Acyl-CoA-binding domain-containing protein 4 [Sesamum angolense]|uniref:Acyl-CoA-binding domain-containing protein 4 n=1 Tax=Sesamum angolense TaxID=2727404 RepID=A0AAE1X289_9LAMI|nr:Acyl-CoA-binding domain-containing protein 4 [Sesamum angolense]
MSTHVLFTVVPLNPPHPSSKIANEPAAVRPLLSVHGSAPFPPTRDRAFFTVRSRAIAPIGFPQVSLHGRIALMGTDSQNWQLELSYDQWVALPVSGQRPAARNISMLGSYVFFSPFYDKKSDFIAFLPCFKVFDLKSLTWSTIKLNMETDDMKSKGAIPFEGFPATSGHIMIKWKTRLLLLAGLSKNTADRVTVWFIDLESHNWRVAETFGNVPVARSGQSVTLFGSKLIMFGGEDWNRRLLNDVNVLDLETMTWSAVETTQTPPTPRFDHVATLHAERYLFVFGGCSHSVFFNDLHVLDLETMEWSQPQVQGDLVTPRAGHAGVAVEGNWFIVGGGDNKSGALETLVINLSKLVVSVVTSVKGRDPLASEVYKQSLQMVAIKLIITNYAAASVCLCYEGQAKDSLHPKILQSPAAAAAAASVTAAYALAKAESLDFPEKEDSNAKVIQVDRSQQDHSVEINSIKEEKKALESSLTEVTNEISALKTKIDEANGNYNELSKELHSVQGQLVAERSRCAKLEAQIGELQKMLESLPSLEEKIQALRAEKSAFERDMELAATVQSQRWHLEVGCWISILPPAQCTCQGGYMGKVALSIGEMFYACILFIHEVGCSYHVI